jgi:hypothetical protein
VGCEASGIRPIIQERIESSKVETFIVHKPVDHFFINMHSFHNAHLLRSVLPRDLTAPIPLFEDRRTKHDELAAALRELNNAKQAARVRKEKDAEEGKSKKRKRNTNTRQRQSKRVHRDEHDDHQSGPSNVASRRSSRVGMPTWKLMASDGEVTDEEDGLEDGGEDESEYDDDME